MKHQEKHMHKKPSQEPQSLEQPLKESRILNWLKDFISTVPTYGSCLALLFLAMGELIGVYLLAVFSITYLIVVMGYLLTMMRTYGSQVQVEVSVDIGEILEVMASLLLTIVVLLVQYHS